MKNALVKNAHLQIPVVLERPFLATTDIVINCRNDIVNLPLRMTLELNVYSICKQPNIDYDEVKGVNSTEEIHEAGDVISLCISDLLEFVLIMIDSFLGRHNFDDDTQILKCLNGALCSHIV